MNKLLVTVALSAAFVSTAAFAQGYGGGFMQRDQSRAEAQQRADMLFQMLDANRDGVVTRAEAEQAAAQFGAQRTGDGAGRGAGRMQRMIDQAFGASQSLTLPQFEAQALARFDAQDLNHDGVVTAAERQEMRQQRIQAQPPLGSPPAMAVPPSPQPHQ